MTRLARKAIVIAAAGLAALLAPLPVAAQVYSNGFKFLEAVKKKDGDVANELLNEPGSTVVNARDVSTGETGLHIAVARRDLTWIKFLSQKGANANIADGRGVTPIILAAQLGFLEGVEALIAGGARVDVANNAGETPLIYAIHSNNRQLAEILLKAGADADRRDNSGRSARDYAGDRGGNARMLQTIVDHERADAGAEQATYGPSF